MMAALRRTTLDSRQMAERRLSALTEIKTIKFPGLTAKQTSLLLMNKSYPQKEVEALCLDASKLFKELDTDKSGALNLVQFSHILGVLDYHSAGKDEPSTLSNYLFMAIDRNRKGKITLSDFHKWIFCMHFGSVEEKIRFGFDFIDTSRDGRLNHEEILAFVDVIMGSLAHFNIDTSCFPQLAALFDDMYEEDGKISFNSFRNALIKEHKFSSFEMLFCGWFPKPQKLQFGKKEFQFMILVMISIERVLNPESAFSAIDQESRDQAQTHGWRVSKQLDENRDQERTSEEGKSQAGGIEMLHDSYSQRHHGALFRPLAKPKKRDNSIFLKSEYHETTSENLKLVPAASRDSGSVCNFNSEAFSKLRQHLGIKDSDLVSLLGVRRLVCNLMMGNLACLSGHVSAGKSGSFFLRSPDNRFFIKTVGSAESKNFREMTPDYIEYVMREPHSTLCTVLGHFQIELESQVTTFVLMKNVCFKSGISIDQVFDLKGSTYHRQSTPEERAEMGSVLKDLDFAEMRGQLGIGHNRYELLQQLQRDVAFLNSRNCIDYSLLVMIHKSNREAAAEHYEWINQHRDELERKYEALVATPPNAASCDLGEVSFSSFAKWADSERFGYRSGAGSKHTLQLSDGLKSYSLNEVMDLITGDEIYFMGIIDYLVPYDGAKASEHLLKTAIGQVGHSVCPPPQYASRFIEFATRIFKYVTEEEPNVAELETSSSLRQAVDSNDFEKCLRHPSLEHILTGRREE